MAVNPRRVISEGEAFWQCRSCEYITRHAIQVEIRSVYGKLLVYPADEVAELFAGLTGKLTFNPADLHRIRQLGFEITTTTGRLLSILTPDYGDVEVVDS